MCEFLLSRRNLGKFTIDDCLFKKSGKKADAKEYLIGMLNDQDMLSSHIISRMSQLGVSRRTVFSAKKEAGIQAYRLKNNWYWRLPKASVDGIVSEMVSEQIECERGYLE